MGVNGVQQAMSSRTEGREINGQPNGQVNGHTNGQTNGSANGHTIHNSNGVNGNSLNQAGSHQPFKPIAICGMACRLPGKISSPHEMWKFLAAGEDARSPIPDTRWSATAWYSPTKKKGMSRTQHGYFLHESVDIGALDSAAFPMPKGEIERMDPQQKLLLEVARECLDDSGEVDWEGSNTGVYVGCFGQDWYDVLNRETLKYSHYQITGSHDFMVSERISHELDLHGPCLTIRTACSSSMIALNDACMAIAKGDCKAAIVGGTSLHLSPATVTSLSENGVFSPDGSSKTFSANANGFARGEGIVALHVKSLDDAIRDGNAIRAVISGIATNFDGKTPTMGRPSAPSQEAAIRRAYEVAGISDVWKTGLFECHGTGTNAGDPVETAALASVFGEKGIYISSLKPNLGHSEGAAGVSGVMKAVLALENRAIPPSIKAWPLSPKIPFEKAKLSVASELTPWPAGRHERVSINSFGIAGANGHAIVDSARSYGILVDASNAAEAERDQPNLFIYSAHNDRSLETMGQNLESFLEATPESFQDIAYTLGRRRRHLQHRSFVVSSKFKPGKPAPPVTEDVGAARTLVMVFTGQGAQWPQMGRDLISSNKVFAKTIKAIDAELQLLGADWTIEDELRKNSRSTRVNEAEYSQPLCTAIQIALVETFASLGIRPAAVVGHSSGEFAAAYAAGALTLSETVAVAFHRGKTSKLQTKQGSMAAVGMGWEDAEKLLIPGVVIACHNSHSSVTLSGDADAVASVVAKVKAEQPQVPATVLKVERAYHSHHMVEIGEDYYQAMISSGVVGARHNIPFFSSVSGAQLMATKLEQSQLGPRYWQKNLENPVLFKSAVVEILKHPGIENPVFLEVGPHGAMEGPLRQILTNESRKAPHVSSLTRRQSGTECLLTAIGKLWSLHINVDFSALMPTGRTLNDLPCYPWDHQKTHWYEPRVSREWRLGGHKYHDLLGRRLPESTAMEPMWRNLLHLENVPWVYDHRLENDIVFPLAGFLAMAVEAALQLGEDRQTPVHLRDVIINNALPINEDSPTELVTTLRRHRLTDTLDSEWWEFSISSHNGNIWSRHCTGQVRAGPTSESEPVQFTTSSLPKKVDSRKWYEALHRKRLSYGPQFTSMENISTSAAAPSKALADLRNNWHGDEANYPVHPVIIDAFFQLQSTAAYNGQAHRYRRLVPTGLDHMMVSPCRQDRLQLSVTSEAGVNSGAIADGQCIVDSNVVVASCSGVRLAVFEAADTTAKNDFPLTARSQWVSHIDYGDLGTRFQSASAVGCAQDEKAFEDFVSLAIQYSRKKAQDANPTAPHLQKYKAWLQEQSIASPEKVVDTTNLLESIKSTASRLETSAFADAAKAIYNICIDLDSIFTEQKGAQEILATESTLDKLLSSMSEYDNSKFLRELGLFKPNLRILELGAGSGSKTAKILKSLRHEKGQNLFSRYVLADASTGLLDVAKKQFKGIPNLEFASFNIERELADQDFDSEEFDLVIASGILRSSKNFGRTLSRVRKLLSPKGRLLVQDSLPGSAWVKFVFGLLPWWWNGAEDGRMEEPYISQDRWAKELVAAGLGTNRIIQSNNTIHHSIVAVAQRTPEETTVKKVTVVIGQETAETELICDVLLSRGYEIIRQSLQDTPVSGQNALVLLDLEGPFLWNLTEARFKSFQNFVANLQGTGVMWVTRQSQAGVEDPRYAPMLGLARTVRSELATNFATCEVNRLTDAANVNALIDVFSNFQDRKYDGALGPEYEYAIENGAILVNRFFPFELDTEIRESLQASEASLAIGKVGQLATLHWSGRSSVVLKDDEVEVEVHAAGLNFRDVLVASGILVLPETNFGYEAAGVVRKLGPKATKFSIGDRVLLSGYKTFSTSAVQSEMLCAKITDSVSLLDAAASPLVFLTAIYGLVDIGRLEEGQSVLIHSAAGGVGIAAIQVAKMLKAKVYCTVSSAEKKQFLIDHYGIPSENIFDSRSTSFATDVMRRTGGRGVDVALNSLSGELLHATWDCIAKWGTLVEIGKRDLLGSAKLDMKAFSDNRNYCCIDIDQMAKERPQLVERLLRRLTDHLTRGELHPIPISQVFPASEAPEAIRHMQQGKHIGKIVLQMRDEEGKPLFDEAQTPTKRPVELDSSASYLLIGGLGGLGRSVALYMAQRGARNLIFLSRTADKSSLQHQEYILELESLGVYVQCVQGNAANQADIERSIDGAVAPVKGILNLTVALADEAFSRMSINDWKISVDPKINGTWNALEVAKSRGLQLDFLVLISSLSGIIGQAGQANYSSANTFLDAFSQYSTKQGVPCTAITFGVMEDIGVMSGNVDLLKKLQGSGWRLNNESELLEAVDSAMQLSMQGSGKAPAVSYSPMTVDKTRFVFGLCPTVPLSSPESYTNLRADVRMAVYHNSKAQTQKSNVSEDALRTLLSTAKKSPATLESDESVNLLAIEIGKKFCSLLLLPTDKLDPSMKTADMGLDSLVAVEMVAWWKVTFGLEMSTLEIVNMGTLEALGKRAAEDLFRLHSDGGK